jgi:hypothetical protein
VKSLPASYQDAHNLTQSMRDSVLFDKDVYGQIVGLTRDLAVIRPGLPNAKPANYVGLLEALNSHFEQGLGLLKASKHVFPRIHDTEKLLTSLVKYLKVVISRIKENEAFGEEDASLLNQWVIEALTLSNRFFVLPPEEGDVEAKFLMKRMKAMMNFANRPSIDTLFPQKAGEFPLDPVVAGHLAGLRPRLADAVGTGLIELTYRMNVQIHTREALTKKRVVDPLAQIRTALQVAMSQASPAESQALPVLASWRGPWMRRSASSRRTRNSSPSSATSSTRPSSKA